MFIYVNIYVEIERMNWIMGMQQKNTRRGEGQL